MKLSIHYKIGITVTILGLAYLAAHAIYLNNNRTTVAKPGDLKQRALQLSKEMKEFLEDRGRLASSSPSPGPLTWEEETDAAVRRYQETFKVYELRFSARVKSIRNELAENGLTDPELDKEYDRPINVSAIRKVGERIGVLADMLPTPTASS